MIHSLFLYESVEKKSVHATIMLKCNFMKTNHNIYASNSILLSLQKGQLWSKATKKMNPKMNKKNHVISKDFLVLKYNLAMEELQSLDS